MSAATGTLRAAEVEDVPGILTLEQTFEVRERWSAGSWTTEIEADNRVVLVAQADDVAAVVSVQIVGGVADLNRIIVDPAHRGAGLGRELLDAGIQAAYQAEADEMLLEVRHDNAPAMAMYASAGFVEIARRANYYQQGADAVVLRLDLTDEAEVGPEGTS